MSYKTIIILFLILFGAGIFVLQKKAPTNQNFFIVGTAAGYAPFVSINEKGIYEGFDIDVAKAIAHTMGKELLIKDLGSMTSLFMALDQGQIDAIIWGLSITQDRLKNVAMLRYQGEPTLAYTLLFWKQIPVGIQTIDAMHNMTICVEPSSSQDAVLSKYPFIKKLTVDRIDDALMNIQYGKADAAFVEPAIAKKFKARYPEIKTLAVPLAEEDQVQGIGIAIKKDNCMLIQHVQQALDILAQNDTLTDYALRWGIS